MLLCRRRFLETFSGGFLSYSIYRQGKMLLKMMDNDKRKKKNSKEKVNVLSKNHPYIMQKEIPSIRMATLNKIFMSHVTSIMASGQNSYKIQGLGLEVTKVEIDRKFNFVRVFWIAQNNKLDDEKVANVLKATAGELQHEISSLRFMGRWPEIRFVRDVYMENYEEVIKIIDGLDLNEGNQDFSSDSNMNDKHNDNEFITMRQDLFGLNHSEIMGKLKARIEKEAAILTEHSSPQPSCSKGATLIPFDKSTFSKYYARQRILQKKLRHNEELLIEDYDTDDDAIHENEERDPDHFS